MGANNKGLATPRTPKEGHEAEFVTVLAAAMATVESIDNDGKGDEILDILTNPRKPGLFSPSLESLFRRRAQAMIDAVWQLRRLRQIADGPPQSSYRREVPDVGTPSAEKDLRWWIRGLTVSETICVENAAAAAYWRIQKEREEKRKLPDHCPKCGGKTEVCHRDGSRPDGRYKAVPPYRICGECAEITPTDPDEGVINLNTERERRR